MLSTMVNSDRVSNEFLTRYCWIFQRLPTLFNSRANIENARMTPPKTLENPARALVEFVPQALLSAPDSGVHERDL